MPNPLVWGECGWDFITHIILNYPDDPTLDDQKNYYLFLNQIQYVLPCKECQMNMSEHLKKIPLTRDVLSSRKSLLKWRIDLQNMVNKKLGKKELSYSEALSKINDIYNKKHPKKSSENKNVNNIFDDKTINIALIIALIIGLAIFTYYVTKKN